MRTLSSLVAVVSLFLTVVSLAVIGGAAFALLLFFPLFLLALVGVLAWAVDHDVPASQTFDEPEQATKERLAA